MLPDQNFLLFQHKSISSKQCQPVLSTNSIRTGIEESDNNPNPVRSSLLPSLIFTTACSAAALIFRKVSCQQKLLTLTLKLVTVDRSTSSRELRGSSTEKQQLTFSLGYENSECRCSYSRSSPKIGCWLHINTSVETTHTNKQDFNKTKVVHYISRSQDTEWLVVNMLQTQKHLLTFHAETRLRGCSGVSCSQKMNTYRDFKFKEGSTWSRSINYPLGMTQCRELSLSH